MKPITLVTTALTAFASMAEAQQAEAICQEPEIHLVGLESNADNTFLHVIISGEPTRIMIDGYEIPQNTVLLNDLVEEGIVSTSMGDYYTQVIGGLLNQIEESRDVMVSRNPGFNIFATQATREVTLNFASRTMSATFDTTNPDDVDALMGMGVDNARLEALLNIFTGYERIFTADKQVLASCTLN